MSPSADLSELSSPMISPCEPAGRISCTMESAKGWNLVPRKGVPKNTRPAVTLGKYWNFSSKLAYKRASTSQISYKNTARVDRRVYFYDDISTQAMANEENRTVGVGSAEGVYALHEILSAEPEARLRGAGMPCRLVVVYDNPRLGHLRRQHVEISKPVDMLVEVIGLMRVLPGPRPIHVGS